MYDELVAGMRRQILLIEKALNRSLTDEDEPKDLGSGVFYLNTEEIVRIDGNYSERISYFLLAPEMQHDILLNYARE